MLKTCRATAAALLTFAASTAAAENYDILMMENAFFPEINYVQPGDTITFVNMSGLPRSVDAIDDSWTTGQLIDGATLAFSVDAEMQTQFRITERPNNTTDGDAVGNGTDGTLTDDNVSTTDGTSGGTTTDPNLIYGQLSFADQPQFTSN